MGDVLGVWFVWLGFGLCYVIEGGEVLRQVALEFLHRYRTQMVCLALVQRRAAGGHARLPAELGPHHRTMPFVCVGIISRTFASKDRRFQTLQALHWAMMTTEADWS